MYKYIQSSSDKAKLKKVKSLLSNIYDSMEELYMIDPKMYDYTNLGTIQDDVEISLREVSTDLERM